jgi:hypothetical protein
METVAKVIQFIGLMLMAAGLIPFGRMRNGAIRHPWFFAYGVVIFILGNLVLAAYFAMQPR